MGAPAERLGFFCLGNEVEGICNYRLYSCYNLFTVVSKKEYVPKRGVAVANPATQICYAETGMNPVVVLSTMMNLRIAKSWGSEFSKYGKSFGQEIMAAA